MILLPLLFYGSMALTALWATWHDRDLRLVGGALLFSFVASNLAWFFADVTHRPGIFTVTEMLVVLAAYLAWDEKRRRALIAVVAVAVASIAANVAFSLSLARAGQVHTYEVLTNALFFMECMLVIGVGVSDAYRAGRFSSGARLRRSGSQSHAARQDEA